MKEPDEFISFTQRALIFAKDNTMSIVSGLLAVSVVIFGVLYYFKYSGSQKEAFFNQLNEKVSLANKDFNAGKFEEARKKFEQILEDSHKYPLFNEIATVGIAYSQMNNDDYLKSIQLFEELIARTNLQYPGEELHRTLARLYEKTGTKDKAIEMYNKLIQTYPNSAEISIYIDKLSALTVE